MKHRSHTILTASQARAGRLKSRLLVALLIPLSAFTLYAIPKIVDYSDSKILGLCLLIGWMFSVVLYLLKFSGPADYAELSPDDYKELSEKLIEVPHLKPIFQEAIKAGKSIRYRDYQFVSSIYEPLRAERLKTSAEQAILQSK